MDDLATSWARETWRPCDRSPPARDNINYSGLAEEADGLRDAVYGDSHRRSAEIRSTYDPDGLFEAAARRP